MNDSTDNSGKSAAEPSAVDPTLSPAPSSQPPAGPPPVRSTIPLSGHSGLRASASSLPPVAPGQPIAPPRASGINPAVSASPLPVPGPAHPAADAAATSVGVTPTASGDVAAATDGSVSNGAPPPASTDDNHSVIPAVDPTGAGPAPPPGVPDTAGPPPAKAATGKTGSTTQAASAHELAGLGTFTGVFRPTILTILGMMAYLRMGWVVGEAGLFGALAILVLIYCITLPTALSLSSITTNIRLGSGGVFALIARSLGLETGGAIGIPLYLGQALSGALYIYGFSEAWLFIFPKQPQWIPLLGCFILVSTITAVSTRLAFKLQGIVMILVIASMMTVFLGVFHIGDHVPELRNPELIGHFKNASFWELFAVIFPAGTGLMVGTSMSGALKSPRKSIPFGTLAAVITSFFVYLSFILWYSVVASPEQLSTDFLISINKSAWKPAVLAGIVASTFTASLSSLAASPQILYALSVHKILPSNRLNNFLAKLSKDGTPRNATFFTIGLIGISLSLGSLNRIAVLITVFFLLTYLSINMVLLIEQSLGMISFRPMLKIPMWVAALGGSLSIFAVVIISPTFAVISIGFILAIYIWLANRKLASPWETVRSSIFVALADWAARRVATGPSDHNERSWKPDLLVPVQSRSQADGNFRFLRALAYPKGSVQLVGFSQPDPAHLPGASNKLGLSANAACDIVEDDPYLKRVAKEFRRDKLYATAVTIDAVELVHGIEQACAVLHSNYSPPSIIFALASNFDDEQLQKMTAVSKMRGIGLAILCRHPQSGLGRERVINVWIRNQAPDWNLALKMASIDIALLLAYQLAKNWHGQINLITVVDNEEQVHDANAFLSQLVEDARLPKHTEVVVKYGKYQELIRSMPQADLQIVGMSAHTTTSGLAELMFQTNSSVMAVHDSGHESALA